MSLTINVSGTVQEIIQFAKLLEAGEKTSRATGSSAVWAYIDEGSLIRAVKQYREETGCTLKEAKDFVEALPGAMAKISAIRAAR